MSSSRKTKTSSKSRNAATAITYTNCWQQLIFNQMNEFFNKLKNMHGVTRLDLRGSDVNPAKHLYVTVSKMHCTSNEVEEVQKMLHSQKWFEWTFNLVP